LSGSEAGQPDHGLDQTARHLSHPARGARTGRTSCSIRRWPGGSNISRSILDRLDSCAEEVVATSRQNYPSLDIPFHARWRHFSVDGSIAGVRSQRARPGPITRRWRGLRFDLAIVSVLPRRRRRAGLDLHEAAPASASHARRGLRLQASTCSSPAAFSSRPDDPFREEPRRSRRSPWRIWLTGFQAGPDNPLVGLDGRVALLNRLGQTLAASPDVFGQVDSPRPAASTT
jgi:hypothetical protein